MEEETVVVKVFSSEVEAELAQAYLQEEGITAFLTGKAAAGMLDRSLKHGISLLTLASQAAPARELLTALEAWAEDDAEAGADVVSLEAETARMFAQLGTALVLFGGMVLLLVGIAAASGSGTWTYLAAAAVLFVGAGAAMRAYGRRRAQAP